MAAGENGPRVWERAWTVQEMRKEAGNWSLAGDAGVSIDSFIVCVNKIHRTFAFIIVNLLCK